MSNCKLAKFSMSFRVTHLLTIYKDQAEKKTVVTIYQL